MEAFQLPSGQAASRQSMAFLVAKGWGSIWSSGLPGGVDSGWALAGWSLVDFPCSLTDGLREAAKV